MCLDLDSITEEQKLLYGNWDADHARVLKIDFDINPKNC